MRLPTNQILQGDVREMLQTLPDRCVDMVMTSPPYWALRDYRSDSQIWPLDNTCDFYGIEHEWGENKEIVRFSKKKHQQGGKPLSEEEIHEYKTRGDSFCSKCSAWRGSLGLEPTFDLFINHLCDIFDNIKRVLKDDGTVWVNLGDTYSSTGGAKDDGGNLRNKEALLQKKTRLYADIQVKSLIMIPFRFAIEMVNRGWILRNVIIWHKPSCMPSSAKDRFTVDFEYLFFFSKQKRYYFEPQYEPHTEANQKDFEGRERRNVLRRGTGERAKHYDGRGIEGYDILSRSREEFHNPLGRNKRAVWKITNQPFSEAHFAVYPEELCETPIKSGCPKYICTECGKAREKIWEVVGHKVTESMRIAGSDREGSYYGTEQKNYDTTMAQKPSETKKRILESMGQVKNFKWSDCGCNAPFKAGIVLDPFIGSGTVGVVARKLARNFIGIELNPEYVEIAEKRTKKYVEQRNLNEVL